MSVSAFSFPLSKPCLTSADIQVAISVLESSWYGYGPICKELESKFSVQGQWALATNNCTAAIWILANIIPHKQTNEIIMPSINFISSYSAFKLCGWKVVLADVDQDSGLINIDDVYAKISAKTKAILTVDLYGQQAPVDKLAEIARKTHAFLCINAAHRMDFPDERLTNVDFICLSFGPTKEVSAPDGGMLIGNVPELELLARASSFVGLTRDTLIRTQERAHLEIAAIKNFGLKLQMTDLTAAIICNRLPVIIQEREHRRAIQNLYNIIFEKTSATLPPTLKNHIPQYYRLGVDRKIRSELRKILAKEGIATSDHYPPLQDITGDHHQHCPNARLFYDTTLILPLYTSLSLNDATHIANVTSSNISTLT
jgi:dTDP-4-amino-4,6-dideoxygalactose transaminase